MKLIHLNENIELNAIKIFGTTANANKAAFITINGSLLDFSGGQNRRIIDHRSICDAFDGELYYKGPESLLAFMNKGNIRLSPEIPGIELILEPTNAQYNTLLNVIKQLGYNRQYFSIQISDKNGYQIDFWDYEHISIKSIIEDLKYYFKTNKVPQNEAYLDDELKFYDYGTSASSVESCDIFDKSKTGVSYYDDILHDAKYMRDRKGVVGSIIMMTPNLYFDECAKLFNSTRERQILQTKNDENIIEHLRDVIIRYHRKFPICFLNYNDDGQEGRHRMIVAGELCGYDKPLPVLIVQNVNDIKYPDDLILKESYYNEIDLSSEVDDETILQDLKNNFEVTNKPAYGGYYILPTGEFLKSNNHLDIDKYLMKKKYIKNQDLDFADGSQFLEVKLNCIRVRSRGGKDSWISPYIVLPKHKPSVTQLYSLLTWLDFVFSNKQTVLIHAETNGEYKTYNYNDYTSDEVLDKINRYYSSGKLLN